MRTGFVFFAVAVAISVVIHLMALVGVALSARPKPFAAVPVESVTVDIVAPDEVPQAPEAPKEALLVTVPELSKTAAPPQAAGPAGGRAGDRRRSTRRRPNRHP